jgi:hypothetical protein
MILTIYLGQNRVISPNLPPPPPPTTRLVCAVITRLQSDPLHERALNDHVSGSAAELQHDL